MISWLKGEIIHTWKISSKKGVVLNVCGVGYEIQLLPTQIGKKEDSNKIALWIHQINREDITNLYGFREVNQRDLFREIISVNGIGPQIGIAMLEDFEVSQLVNAIEKKESNLLIQLCSSLKARLHFLKLTLIPYHFFLIEIIFLIQEWLSSGFIGEAVLEGVQVGVERRDPAVSQGVGEATDILLIDLNKRL